MSARFWAGLLAAGVAALSPIAPARAQSWNFYGNGSQFFIPFTDSDPNNAQSSRTISLTLSGITQNYLVDTGSLGLVTTLGRYFNPSSSDVLVGNGSITYSTSGTNPTGPVYLTNVTINGANGQSVVSRIPVLASNTTVTSQLGVGFDRGGITMSNGVPLSSLYNPNLLLGVVSSSSVNVSAMQPGYIVGFNGFSNLGLGPGIILGLTNQNTSGFALQQLTPTGAGLPPGCTTTGMNCPQSWNGQVATVSVGGRSLGPMSVLPDSGIGYMLIQYPNAGIPTATANCGNGQTSASNCVPTGTVVQVFLPGQSQAAYSFVVTNSVPSGNPSQPYGVSVFQGADQPQFANLGRTYFENLTYFYDPINGFVGYQATNIPGTSATIVPLLALQGNLTLPNGFLSSFPTFLTNNVALTQNGSGTMTGPILGAGGLTLQSGNLTLSGTGSYTGGTVVNGGALTIGSTGSIVGALTVNNGASFTNNGTVSGSGLLTVNAGATFTNSGTYNTPGIWQLNQGTYTNSGTFTGNLANTGTATNSGTLTGSVINGNAGSFTNSGTVVGSVANMGSWNGNGTIIGNFVNSGLMNGNSSIQGNLANSGVLSPGNSIGTIAMTGNFSNAAGSTYFTEVVGGGQSDRITVGGTANLQGGTVVVSALPGLPFAPSTTYTILSTNGGLTGTFAAVNELYPFLTSSLSYDANNAYLTLAVNGFAAQATNNLQYTVGSVLDASAPAASGDYATVLGTLATATAQQGQAVMTAISGNNYAGFSSFGVMGAQLFMNNFASQASGGSPTNARVALAEACDVACDTASPPRWGAWGGGFGGLGTIGAGQPVGTVSYNAAGFATGLDRLVTDTVRVGVTAGYTAGSQWVNGFTGNGRSDTFQTGLYANYAQDKVYADALVGYAYTWNQMWRQISIPGLQPRTAYGTTGTNQFFGQVETGYRFDLGTNANAFITPFARLQAYTGNQNAFTETGAQSLNLTIAQQTTNSLRSVLGAQIGGSMDLGWREKLFAQLRLGWSHEYANVGRPVTATLAGAPGLPFTTWGVSPQTDGAVIGLSANTAIAEATSVYFRYEGLVSGQDNAHAFTAGLRMTW